MAERITKTHFAQRCMHIARLAASWGADSLDCLDEVDQSERPETVFRFTDEIRRRLDSLDEQAGRRTKPATDATPTPEEN